MNNISAPRPSTASTANPVPGAARKGLSLAIPALIALGGTGCFRASGLQRTTVVSEAMPETGGDRVNGLKSMAGPGDYYLGNDFIHIAVDGTTFGNTVQLPIAGAAGGGSIVDAGFLSLDTSYQRVNMPSDSLERLTPVVNQDPELEIVFDTFLPDNHASPTSLTMTGRILDPGHKIANGTVAADGTLKGVKVTQVITLGELDRYFTLSTTIVNESGAANLGIRNIGDYLYQSNGGYLFNVPAGITVNGSPLAKPWGVEIPGSNFGSPIATAVKAPMVGLMALEPGAGSQDSHASMGIMSQDTSMVLVTSDPQHVLAHDKPVFPNRLVVGSMPLPPAGLAAGGSLSYTRRLYISGGASTSAVAPNNATMVFNQMAAAKYNTTDGLWPQDFGTLTFSLMGTAMHQGPLPTEVRIERIYGTTADSLGNPVDLYAPERVDWLEPGENISSQSSFASSTISALVPVGVYRLVITNQAGTLVKTQCVNSTSGLNPLLVDLIKIQSGQYFTVGSTDYLCPEAASIVSTGGTVVHSLYSVHFFETRPAEAPSASLQPLRITIKGLNGTPDPWVRRARTLGSVFDPITKATAIAGGNAPGQIQFRAGNEMFGTAFHSFSQTRYFWLANGSTTGQTDLNGNPVVNNGSYRAYGTRGPLSTLNTLDALAYDGQYDNTHSFIVWAQPLPTGWTTFDVPGPSMATTGGMLPTEKLASAMAEGVQVVGHTEQDLGTDAQALYNDFKTEFNGAYLPATYLTAINNDPFVVGARSSALSGFGTVTALFTPQATRYRFGGAQQPRGWNLADFITQAQGQYTVVHRPRAADGLFSTAGVTANTLQDPASWWFQTGPYSNGVKNGAFDAIELLRAEGFNGADPDPWFQEFLQVRKDWWTLLNQQTPANFTKALGLSSAKFTLDTPVGLARTYLKAAPVLTNPPVAQETPDPKIPLVQDLSSVLAALKSGAAVASTGPLLDVTVGSKGPGGLVAGPMATANVAISVYRRNWMPVDEIRIVVNGQVVSYMDPSTFTQPTDETQPWTRTVAVPMPTTGTGAWIVVEAGVKETQTGPYMAGTPWHEIMRGIYPIAVTNPIFVDVTGHGYTHP